MIANLDEDNMWILNIEKYEDDMDSITNVEEDN